MLTLYRVSPIILNHQENKRQHEPERRKRKQESLEKMQQQALRL